MKSYTCFLIVVSGVFVLDYIRGKILRKMVVVVCSFFEKMSNRCFSFLCIYLLYVFYYLGYLLLVYI